MDTRKAQLVTFDAVAASAESLVASGQRPTVRAVIAQLGGGSPNAVLPHLQAWKGKQTNARVATIELDPRIAAIVAEQIRAAVAAATAAADDRTAELEADAQAVAEAGRMAEERAVELAAELQHVQAECEQLKGRLAALTDEGERARRESAAAAAQANADASTLRGAAEEAREKLARAELRLERLPSLEAMLERVQAELDAERASRVNAEKALAVAEAQRDGALDEADDAREHFEKLVDQVATMLAGKPDPDDLPSATKKVAAKQPKAAPATAKKTARSDKSS